MKKLLLFILAFGLAGFMQARGQEATHSVLSSGKWVKLRVKKTGVYRLSSDQLKKWGFNNIATVSVWGNGCEELPRRNNESNKDDLLQLPVRLSNNNRTLLFYAEATNTWSYNTSKRFYEHRQNEFSEYGYIYITDGQPPSHIPMTAQVSNATDVTGTYDYRDFRERIDTSLQRSGRRFFGEQFRNQNQRTFTFSIPNLDLTNPQLKLQVCAGDNSTSVSTYSISVNGGNSYVLTVSATFPGATTYDYSIDTALFENIPVANENISILATYNRPSASAWGIWDFSTINARANLKLQNSQLLFRDANTVGAGRSTNFNIATTQQNVRIWDVTNMNNVQEVGDIAASGNISFTMPSSTLREYVAFTEGMAMSPEYVGAVSYQNLHGENSANMIIVAHPNFIAQAERLAEFHRTKDNMSVLVASTEQIYNEFSSGIPDVSAIRNFVRMFWRRYKSGVSSSAPEYLLLFGSGSYINYENKKGVGLIPTYQSDESLIQEKSYVSDDFFVLLDDDEYLSSNGMVGKLDMAVGRLPASNSTQANTLVDKILQYSSNLSGDWMSQCIIIADDEDGNSHMDQAEKISSYIMDSVPSYHVNKIYFDAYTQQSTPMGERYPDVTNAINSAICNGALLVNYTGHANDQWISHEQVVTINDIKRWNNRSRLPLFVTATCEFSRFDNPWMISAGEEVLFLPNGGSIAMLSTTRLVFSSANYTLNEQFIKEFFKKENGKNLRLGEMVRRTKNTTSTGINQLNFSLLGDPALMLNFPTLNVSTTQINGLPSDTLKALDKARISGSVASSNLNDTIYISIFDKEQTKKTLANGSGQTPFTYRTQNNLLYKGKITTPNGNFTAQFIVPQDISPQYGNGKIKYIGKAGNQLVAGSQTVVVGGAAVNATIDTTPPGVRMYMNDEHWVPGGTTSEAPTFIALLSDSSGINTTGNGVGRDITLKLQQNSKTYTLNNYYAANTDSYTSGRIEFPIPPLEKGPYTATFKVWDVFNNSTEQSIEFRVADDDHFALNRVLNYPNPFTQKTAFFFEHNRPYIGMDVLIQVFTISGKLVKTIRHSIPQSSNALRSSPIEWDGRDDYGSKLGRGTYLYKVKVRCNSGEYAEKLEKIVLLN